MADISAITALDGVTYSIKDSEARDHLVPTGGTTGQVLTKTASGYDWQTGGSGGGNVDTVNGISPDVDKNVQVDVELTKAEYDALPSSKLTDDVNYWITDGANNPLNNNMYATGVVYDNTDSGLTATNAQDAIDELSADLTPQYIDDTDISFTRLGKYRHLTVVRKTRPEILSFLRALPSTDLPRREYNNILYKTTTSLVYLSLVFSALKTENGIFQLVLITNIAYNVSNSGDSIVSDSDVVSGALTWFVA